MTVDDLRQSNNITNDV